MRDVLLLFDDDDGKKQEEEDWNVRMRVEKKSEAEWKVK
jgi:hypothetical protein